MDNQGVDTLLRSRDPVLLSQTIMDLCRAEVHAAVPALVKVTASPHPAVRANAAYALGKLGSRDIQTVAPALIRLLADPDPLVRSEAVEALGLLQHAPAIDALITMLQNDADPLVRASAAEILGDFGQPRALTVMIQALQDPDVSVRAYVANSIGLLGAPDLLPILQARLEAEETPRVKAELLVARYRLGKQQDLQQLFDLLADGDESLAIAILNILDDLARRKTPPTISSDSARINEALIALGERLPALRPRALQIIERLKQ
jgi:HEAT repeat protein